MSGLDLAALTGWLEAKLPGQSGLSLEQISGGGVVTLFLR